MFPLVIHLRLEFPGSGYSICLCSALIDIMLQQFFICVNPLFVKQFEIILPRVLTHRLPGFYHYCFATNVLLYIYPSSYTTMHSSVHFIHLSISKVIADIRTFYLSNSACTSGIKFSTSVKIFLVYLQIYTLCNSYPIKIYYHYPRMFSTSFFN